MEKKIQKGFLSKLHQLSFGTKIEIEIFFIIILLSAGTFIFHFVEGWRYLDSFYFTISTMAAVGLGDFAPRTDIGKLLTTFYMIVGMPLFIYTSALFIERRLTRKKSQ
ncbi:MAG: potassium channel family protein [Candidatus Gracilibacteria bacterium]